MLLEKLNHFSGTVYNKYYISYRENIIDEMIKIITILFCIFMAKCSFGQKDSLVLDKKNYHLSERIKMSFKCTAGYGVKYVRGSIYYYDPIMFFEMKTDSGWTNVQDGLLRNSAGIFMSTISYEDSGELVIPPASVFGFVVGEYRIVLVKRFKNPIQAKKEPESGGLILRLERGLYENDTYWYSEVFTISK